MPDIRTVVTELATGLGTLGFESPAQALRARPHEMVSVAPEMWRQLDEAYAGKRYRPVFEAAWENGLAFLKAPSALRSRRPVIIEWKGSHRSPGDEAAPIDLRIDHVYLISCKYLSHITINSSPVHLFTELLSSRHGTRSGIDWFAEVSPLQYQRLYDAVREAIGWSDLPVHVADLLRNHRERLAHELKAGWPDETCRQLYEELAIAVSQESANRWQAALGKGRATPSREAMLWRMLRIGNAPYFILGTSSNSSLRLRVETPWDWRQHYRLAGFDCTPQGAGQARVGWRALVENRHSSRVVEVAGHVEVRWSHGKFGSAPEAKVYLDTPHSNVPGYQPLESAPD